MGKQLLLAFLLVLTACKSSLSWHAGGGGPSSSGGDGASSGHHADAASTWKRFAIRGQLLGSRTDELEGFVCDPDRGKYRHTCVQFLDERCKGRPTKIKSIGHLADVPAGQSCFMDAGSGGTYLDRKFISPPLFSITVVGTDTSAPRTYEINYTFAKDVLTADSNLGKALIAKYGEPTDRSEPIMMTWTVDGTNLRAACGSTEGPTGEFCKLSADDSALLESERALQKTADDQRAVRDAPAAPTL